MTIEYESVGDLDTRYCRERDPDSGTPMNRHPEYMPRVTRTTSGQTGIIIT